MPSANAQVSPSFRQAFDEFERVFDAQDNAGGPMWADEFSPHYRALLDGLGQAHVAYEPLAHAVQQAQQLQMPMYVFEVVSRHHLCP